MKALTVSILEAGRRLGVGRDASYIAAKRGELPIIEIGGRRRVPIRALEKMIENCETAKPSRQPVPTPKNGNSTKRKTA